MQHLRAAIGRLALAIFVALGLAALDRCAEAGNGAFLRTTPNTGAGAPISLLDNRPPPPPPPRLPLFSRLSWLRLRVPGPTGTSVWGASLTLPFPLHVALPHSGTKLPSLRPMPELEIGFRSIGKATGGALQYVSQGGMRIGAGLYFNRIAIGAPPARQAMVTFQIPLPW